MSFVADNINFQTHPAVAAFMASFIPYEPDLLILEPTPGAGALVTAIDNVIWQNKVIAMPEDDFWTMDHDAIWRKLGRDQYDMVIMNPPFSPMETGWKFLEACMELSGSVICLMPWMCLINSEKRYNAIEKYGLRSVTSLPRKAFPDARVQCCVLELERNYRGKTTLGRFKF